MKRVLLILTMVIGCSLLASCEKETMLVVNVSSLSFDNNGGSQPINIVANKAWSASSTQGWCKVSPFSGDGSDNSNFTLSVSCDANATYDERSCTITIVCEELTSTITVTQAEGKGLFLSQTEYNLTNEAQTITLEVQSNIQYSVLIDDACKSWIKQESTKGLSSNTIKFAISKNESYDGREGKITVKQTDGSLSGTVVVKQSQQNGLFVSSSEYNLSNEKHTLTVEVKANVEFDVKSNADWIKYIETKGLKTSQIVLDVAANEDYDGREGTVSVKQKNGNLEGVITIRQEQNYGILVSQSEFSLTNEAQTIDVEVKYNVDFDVVIPNACKSWISIVSTKGLSSRNYTISIAKNETYDNREGSITFKQKNGSLSGTVKVYQSQTDGLIAEKKEYIVSYEEQQLNIKVASNVEYEVYIDEGCRDWLSRVQTKGLTEETLTFRVTKNEGEKRQGKMFLRGKDIQETIIVTQETEGYVEFEDEQFKSYCITHFDENNDGKLSFMEARKVNRIEVFTNNISSLKGIEAFSNLRELSCHPEYDSQSYLANGIIEFSKNGVKVKGGLTKLDVSKNVNLIEIYCYGNQLKELILNNLIERVSCYCNQLPAIDISSCSCLNFFNCEMNNLKTLNVTNNSSLVYLNCSTNQLTSIDISKNTTLVSLYCSYNQFKKIDVSQNPALEDLGCSYNKLSNIDVSKNNKLIYLECENNSLTDIDVRYNTALENFYCKYNKLSSIDVTHNTALLSLECSCNQITTLDMSKNTALRVLQCQDNQLKTLDVSNNVDLFWIICYNNQISNLDIRKNVALAELVCSNNNLSILDCSNNPALIGCDCSSNQISSIDVSNNPSLERLWCHCNKLSFLDVSNCLALKSLYCNNNPELKEIWLSSSHTITDFRYDSSVEIIKYK